MKSFFTAIIAVAFVMLGPSAGAQTPSESTDIRARTLTPLGQVRTGGCRVYWSRTASIGESLSLRRVLNCRDTSTGEMHRLIEVIYEGQTLFTTQGEIGIPPEELDKLASVAPEGFASAVAGHISLEDTRAAEDRKKRIAELNRRLRPAGLAILRFHPYDVSEHTDGTGIAIKVVNFSNKIVKYIRFTYIGLNSVGDPVVDLRGAAARGFQGIGPIEPNESASYDKKYAWMTDIVQRVKIVRIEIEYMDKTKKC